MSVEKEKIAIKDFMVGRGQVWSQEHLSKTYDTHSLNVSQWRWKGSINSVVRSFLDNITFFRKISLDIRDTKLNSLQRCSSIFVYLKASQSYKAVKRSQCRENVLCYYTATCCTVLRWHRTVYVRWYERKHSETLF